MAGAGPGGGGRSGGLWRGRESPAAPLEAGPGPGRAGPIPATGRANAGARAAGPRGWGWRTMGQFLVRHRGVP